LTDLKSVDMSTNEQIYFFQQIVGLVQKFYVGSPLGDLNPLSSPRIEKLMIFPASNASAALPLPPLRCQRCRRISHCRRTAAALPLLLCQRCRPAATAVVLLTLPPPLYRRRCCRPVTLLPHCSSPPPLRCHRRPCAADASAALPAVATPLLRCLRRSANTATALPLLTPRCRCRC
jgi:hypothetical protein